MISIVLVMIFDSVGTEQICRYLILKNIFYVGTENYETELQYHFLLEMSRSIGLW